MAQTELAWNKVESSNIARWRYDPETRVLEMQFVTGDATYSYDDVPMDVAEGLQSAASIGSYFHNNIKGRYRFYRG